jgi:hypothetical protein
VSGLSRSPVAGGLPARRRDPAASWRRSRRTQMDGLDAAGPGTGGSLQDRDNPDRGSRRRSPAVAFAPLFDPEHLEKHKTLTTVHQFDVPRLEALTMTDRPDRRLRMQAVLQQRQRGPDRPVGRDQERQGRESLPDSGRSDRGVSPLLEEQTLHRRSVRRLDRIRLPVHSRQRCRLHRRCKTII